MSLPAEVARVGHALARRTGLDPADGESHAAQAWVEHPECWFTVAYRRCVDEARTHHLDIRPTDFEDWNAPSMDGGLAAVEDRLDLSALLADLNDADLAALARRFWLGLPADDTVCARALRRTRAGTGHRSPLTPRQTEMLQLVADGACNKQVGARLHISPETVRSTLHNAAVTLGTLNRAHAVAVALRAGWIR